jgi:hypothetical protein
VFEEGIHTKKGTTVSPKIEAVALHDLVSLFKSRNKIHKLLTPIETEGADENRRSFIHGLECAEKNLDEIVAEMEAK